MDLITIPSSDLAFRTHVDNIAADVGDRPDELERRLRRLFPRVVVRERALVGEPTAWYVYRDGGWRGSGGSSWWLEESLPRVVVTADGWFADLNETAAGVLGIARPEAAERHFTDFVVPGTLDESLAIFEVIERGHPLTATILLRPVSGDVIAVDLHAWRDGSGVIGVFRLAADVDVPSDAPPVARPGAIATVPPIDVAFRSYVLRALDRMPEPTPAGLALRLRRLYPHAAVHGDADLWTVERDPRSVADGDRGWWDDAALPRVRYDAQALILEANDAARTFLGHELVGHHWQDFVTAGSTEEVAAMLEILGEVGAAESRFRMPRSDGSLVEFDSYTTVTGEEFVTIMRPDRWIQSDPNGMQHRAPEDDEPEVGAVPPRSKQR